MLLRIITASFLIPIVVAIVWWGPVELIAIAVALVAILALAEFFELGERIGIHAFKRWTSACVAAIVYAQYSAGAIEGRVPGGSVAFVRRLGGFPVSIPVILLIFLLGSAAVGLATRRSLHDLLPSISISSAGLLFIALPFSYLVRVSEIERYGRQLLLFSLVLIWAGDMLAYFVGRSVGRLPMAPALSPKKTWEGAVGNLAASLVVAVFFARWMEFSAPVLVAIAALANIGGQMGDLIESAYKRGAVVKDSGALLPGHGGMLDRIDSLIFAAPIVWLLYQWFMRGGA